MNAAGLAPSPERLVAALAGYDLGRVRAVTPVGEGHANHPHRVETDRGRFFVKLLAGRLASPVVLETRHALIQHIMKHGIRTPALMRTRSGDTCAAADVGTLEVCEWIDGEPLDPANVDHAMDAGMLLRELHRAAEIFQPPGPGARRDWLTPDGDLAKLERMEEQVRTYLPAPEVLEQMFHVKHCLRDAARALAEADLPTHMVHGDLVPGNLLRAPDGCLWVTDFDHCHVGPRIFDWALLATAFAGGREASRMLQHGEHDALQAAQTRVLIHMELERGSSVERIAQLLALIR